MNPSPAAEGELQLLGVIETDFSTAPAVDGAPWRAGERVSRTYQRRGTIQVSDHGMQSTAEFRRPLETVQLGDPLHWRGVGHYIARAEHLEEYQYHFPLPNGTCGVLVLCAGRVVVLDLFDPPETFAALCYRLSRAYFFGALRWPVGSSSHDAEPVERFLERLASFARPKTAIGIGADLEINSTNLIGVALVYDSRRCHLVALTEVCQLRRVESLTQSAHPASSVLRLHARRDSRATR